MQLAGVPPMSLPVIKHCGKGAEKSIVENMPNQTTEKILKRKPLDKKSTFWIQRNVDFPGMSH